MNCVVCGGCPFQVALIIVVYQTDTMDIYVAAQRVQGKPGAGESERGSLKRHLIFFYDDVCL